MDLLRLGCCKSQHSFLILTSSVVATSHSNENGGLMSDKSGPTPTPEIACFVSISTSTYYDVGRKPPKKGYSTEI